MIKKKKIYLFIGSLRGGGAEKVCVNLANSLSVDYNVTLCVMNLKNAVYDKHINNKVKLVNLDVSHTRNALHKVHNFLKVEKPKVILSFNHQISILLVFIRSLFRMNYKVISRNIIMLSEAKKEKKSFWQKHIVFTITKVMYKKVDCIISQSKMMKEDLITNFNITANQVKVINNPISKEIEEYSEHIVFNGLKEQDKRVLFVGRLTRQKGLDYLLEAFDKVIEKDSEVSLTIVGEGPLKGWLEEKIKTLNLEDHVFIKEFTNEIINEYRSSDLVVLSSRFEGFPNVLVEAISLGIPIVSFDCPSGPREIIQNKTNGFLVEYQNTNELAEKILESLKTNWDHQEIIKSSKKFSSSNIIKQYDRTLKDFI